MTLNEAAIGDVVKVTSLNRESAIKRRLLDMGITKGVKVEIIGKATFGDPIEITLRGYNLSLRVKECRDINIEVIGK